VEKEFQHRVRVEGNYVFPFDVSFVDPKDFGLAGTYDILLIKESE